MKKQKNKNIEEKLNSILDKKSSEYNNLNIEYNNKKKEEQLLIMKMNNDKITSLY